MLQNAFFFFLFIMIRKGFIEKQFYVYVVSYFHTHVQSLTVYPKQSNEDLERVQVQYIHTSLLQVKMRISLT